MLESFFYDQMLVIVGDCISIKAEVFELIEITPKIMTQRGLHSSLHVLIVFSYERVSHDSDLATAYVVPVTCERITIDRYPAREIVKRITHERGQDISADLARFDPGLQASGSCDPHGEAGLDWPRQYLNFNFVLPDAFEFNRLARP